MSRFWMPGMTSVGFFLCGVHLYNSSVVKCNIKILQEEIANAKNNSYGVQKMKEALLKQRLYQGRLIYLLPPPRFDIDSFKSIVDPRSYMT